MNLKAENRDILGGAVSSLRENGLIPAELYGHGTENLHLSVNKDEFKKLYKEAGENTVIDVVLPGGEKHSVLIHDTQFDNLGNIMHVDFYRVRMDEKITTNVPVEFIGESPAVKEKGGVLNKALSEIEVEAFPQDLPKNFQVDVSSLMELEQSISVGDLKTSENVKILLEPDAVIVSVSEPREEEATVAPSIEDVAVESEEKKTERDSERAEEEKENAS